MYWNNSCGLMLIFSLINIITALKTFDKHVPKDGLDGIKWYQPLARRTLSRSASPRPLNSNLSRSQPSTSVSISSTSISSLSKPPPSISTSSTSKSPTPHSPVLMPLILKSPLSRLASSEWPRSQYSSLQTAGIWAGPTKVSQSEQKLQGESSRQTDLQGSHRVNTSPTRIADLIGPDRIFRGRIVIAKPKQLIRMVRTVPQQAQASTRRQDTPKHLRMNRVDNMMQRKATGAPATATLTRHDILPESQARGTWLPPDGQSIAKQAPLPANDQVSYSGVQNAQLQTDQNPLSNLPRWRKKGTQSTEQPSSFPSTPDLQQQMKRPREPDRREKDQGKRIRPS